MRERGGGVNGDDILCGEYVLRRGRDHKNPPYAVFSAAGGSHRDRHQCGDGRVVDGVTKEGFLLLIICAI